PSTCFIFCEAHEKIEVVILRQDERIEFFKVTMQMEHQGSRCRRNWRRVDLTIGIIAAVPATQPSVELLAWAPCAYRADEKIVVIRREVDREFKLGDEGVRFVGASKVRLARLFQASLHKALDVRRAVAKCTPLGNTHEVRSIVEWIAEFS